MLSHYTENMYDILKETGKAHRQSATNLAEYLQSIKPNRKLILDSNESTLSLNHLYQAYVRTKSLPTAEDARYRESTSEVY